MDMHILNEPYTLTQAQIDFYQDNSYIKLKNVLDQETITFYNKVISKKVEELNTVKLPVSQRDVYGKAFLQLFNLWTQDRNIEQLVMSKRLAGIASELMQVDGVRLYHDQALFKEPGGGITPWHADQYYWPLTTDKTITAWIPLHSISLEMGPLEFSAGSNAIIDGRNLSISSESEKIISDRLRITDYTHVIEPYDIGEISFHSGWVFHRAGANTSNFTRKIMTIIYMDKSMRLKKPINKGQQNDWETWCPGAKIGEVIDTSLNPVLL